MKGPGGTTGSKGFSAGVHAWNVKLEKTKFCSVKVGICSENLNNESLSKNNGYFLNCLSGKLECKDAPDKQYCSRMKEGCVVNVKLDCDAKTLTFGENGEMGNVAFENLPNIVFVPCVLLRDEEDQITIDITK